MDTRATMQNHWNISVKSFLNILKKSEIVFVSMIKVADVEHLVFTIGFTTSIRNCGNPFVFTCINKRGRIETSQIFRSDIIFAANDEVSSKSLINAWSPIMCSS